MEALGLGGLAAAATGKAKSRNRHHRDRSSSSSSRSRSRSRSRRGGGKPRGQEDLAHVIKAAITAGATEALRSRNQPGGWAGEKGKRVLTAAISAGGVDKLLDRDPNKHGTRNVIGSAIAGLATSRLVNGSRSRSRSRGRNSRGRARSESRGGLKDIAGAGLVAAAGKKLFDKVRSKSHGRRSSSSEYDSYDSRTAPRRRDKKKRSSSISAYASKGLAALGLGEAAKANGKDKRRAATFDDDDYSHHRSGRNGAPPPYGGGGYGDSRDVGSPRSGENGAVVHRDANGVDLGPHHLGDPETDSDSDLGSSTDDERAQKKARASQLITAGLASIATIHAANSVYKSMEARDERHLALHTGEITQAEARKQKNKTRVQDAASIGIAALGIKGAVSEWKEAKEKGAAAAELKEKQRRHREKREARRLKMQDMGLHDRYPDSAPSLSPQPSHHAFAPAGPPYYDDNPYAYHQPTRPPPGPTYSPQYQQQVYIPPHLPSPPGPPPGRNY